MFQGGSAWGGLQPSILICIRRCLSFWGHRAAFARRL